MKLLVTGCFGFIGYNFINYVKNNYSNDFEIIGIDSLNEKYSKLNKKKFFEKNNNFEFYNLDINKIQELEYKIDNVNVLINFAAESHVDNSISNPEKFIDSNISGVAKLMKFAINKNISYFYHVSTDEVYGSSEKNFFFEDDKLNPSSPYSASKASAELICNSFMRTYGYNVLMVRPANNYGIYQQPEKLIPFSISSLLSGKNIELYGDGKNIRHWLHVSDTVTSILHLIEQKYSHGVFNIGSGEYHENLYVAQKILKYLDLSEEKLIFVEDRPGHDYRYATNFDKLKNTGWKPKKKFNEEIEKIVHWYKSNEEWWAEGFEEINQRRENRLNLE